ncbi:hypothetical protein [Aliiroseovarius sediminilitoris]|nr:hypothetical protein [Aliiroseovarius sediminilitoris]
MTSRSSCSGLDAIGPEFDEEFRNILDALFCACNSGLQDTDTSLRRELFRMTELDGQTTARAARALGIGISQAEEMLAATRRDITVLMALGLCKPVFPGPADSRHSHGCRCGNSTMARGHKPPMAP